MLLATWNLNNRAGKVRFKPEAALAIGALGADVVVLSEYFPQPQHQDRFHETLASAGLTQQLLSPDTGERANRVLIASRLPIEQDELVLPDFDSQFPASMLTKSWEWLEEFAASRRDTPTIIVGDLNVKPTSRKAKGRHFRRLLASGWTRAEPVGGHSYFGPTGARTEIDHLLATTRCRVRDARYITAIAGFAFADAPSALSDHAVLMADVEAC
jgi:endonuclease/exonuclease/phosphatase family metal-dependent hydrolase